MANEIYGSFDAYKNVLNRLNSDRNVQFIIDEKHFPPNLNYPEFYEIIKRALVYSKYIIILGGKKYYFQDHRDIHDDYEDQSITTPITSFYNTLLNRIDDKSIADTIIHIPRRYDIVIEITANDCMPGTPKLDFYNDYNFDNSISLMPKLPVSEWENTIPFKANSLEPTYFSTLAPHIENLPVEVIHKIKEDNQDSFQRYQYALKKMIGGKFITNDSQYRSIIEEVEYQTNVLHSKLETIRKSRALRAYDMLIGTTMFVLAAILPTEVAKLLGSVIGAYSFKNFTDGILKQIQDKRNLLEGDYFIPWKIDAENAKKSK
jgi:hypothetical protein